MKKLSKKKESVDEKHNRYMKMTKADLVSMLLSCQECFDMVTNPKKR